MRDEIHDINSPFVFFGSDEKINRDKALMSEFRKSIGINIDPFGPITGTQEEVKRKLELLKSFKERL